MKKKIVVFWMLFLSCILTGGYIFAQCHGMGAGGHQHDDSGTDKQDKKPAGKKIEAKERILVTVYTCPMHPEVKSDKSGKCPNCGMKLEKKQILMAYACPEKGCEIQKAVPGACPEHKKTLLKVEVRPHCPKCGEQVNAEDLVEKPVIGK